MINNLGKSIFKYSNNEVDGNNYEKYNFKKEDLTFYYDIPYYIKDLKIDGAILKKIFIFDIRNLNDGCIKCIFDYFYYFQSMFASKYFYQDFKEFPFNYRSNMELIFLYNKERDYNVDKYSIIYDMEYFFKRFMTIEELNEYLNKSYEGARFNKFDVIKLKDENFYLRDFNYIYGSNGSGKTILLNKLSNKLKVPVFSLDDFNLNLVNYIQNVDYMKKYLYMLTGSYELGNYSSFEKYVHRLCQILEFSREHKNILLLDDLRWNSLDSRNKINLIDTLFDYSVKSEGIVITGCNQDQKKLIKGRVYRPNIIDL